ncbi:MAG: carboxy terminal-processing peptidase [Bacteroidetes bacterium]|nr:carboxy terminal-processing peptidase [Bacteroidota bacterium]
MQQLCKLFLKKSLIIPLLAIVFSFTIGKFFFDKNIVIFELILGRINESHYSPLKIDDTFSEKVYDLYLKRIDAGKKFFLQEDVNELSKYRRDIDDEIMAQRLTFYNKSVDLINKRIKEKENWTKEILSEKIDYTKNESYETDNEKSNFATNIDQLKDEWRKMIKYQLLVRIDEEMDKQEKAKEKKDTIVKFKSFDSIEVDAKRKVLKSNTDWFKRLYKIKPRERFALFANAVAGVYDPHTEYFAPAEKKKFDQGMSGQFEGIGARLQQKDGILKVSEIIPGTPSSRSDLKAGDEIIKVAQGAGEAVDITNMDMEDAIDLIKGRKGTEVRLTIRRSGAQKLISIVRDKIKMEESYAKSLLLENKNKIGYIYLPNFYTNFDGTSDHYCAQDVKKEIDSLKKQNIKSLILDLRDNGGGSLMEAINMVGLFINKGPVVQVRERNNYINVYDDKNSSVAWDGPFAILINHNSASASEIVAAAIQDYKRGVIIGTPSFGKGTVQSFADLDMNIIPQFDSLKPTGQVKITRQKFYRINGGATQLKGVTPDVKLPDPYEYIDLGEKEMDNPMPWDEIKRCDYTEFKNINYDDLLKQNKNRLSKSETFNLIGQQAKYVKSRKDDSKYPLNIEKFRAEQKEARANSKKFEELRKEIKGFKADLLNNYSKSIAADSSRLGRENRWAKSVSKDAYIHEATNILNDIK